MIFIYNIINYSELSKSIPSHNLNVHLEHVTATEFESTRSTIVSQYLQAIFL